ncbi:MULTISPECIES: EamA family transporter RarD [unclassified Virgibacillus]|uniref:EamA family transporter RarD n=1 Tax=unclassified Virgibacillus TaxID=2620237 RepID=UPI0024DDF96E|nr:EamA family transporter RarD [Virgibacillus sp. LDC-1]
MDHHKEKAGIIYAALAYLIWGFLPIYWKLLDEVPAGEILAHRIIWSFLFMLIILVSLKKGRAFIKECLLIMQDRKKLVGILFASIFISLNWLAYIWAVNNNHVIQASLGYYINPLVSVLLGILFLKERLTRRQLLSVLLATVGVIYLTFSYGVFPWISLLLALTFGLYGLLKKTVDISAMYGLTLETMLVTPIAIIYLFRLPSNTFSETFPSMPTVLLMGAGIVTAIPLLLFASGAKRIPLALAGFLQYIAPTLMLILGVFVYDETFSQAHLISFALIWLALILYLGSVYRRPTKRRIRGRV